MEVSYSIDFGLHGILSANRSRRRNSTKRVVNSHRDISTTIKAINYRITIQPVYYYFMYNLIKEFHKLILIHFLPIVPLENLH